MNLAHQPPVNRVPGSILKPKEYALGKDLSKLSLRELLDLKNRQLNLLENRYQQVVAFYYFSLK